MIRLGENCPLRQTNKVYSDPAESFESQGGPSFQGSRNATDDINAPASAFRFDLPVKHMAVQNKINKPSF